MPAFWDTSALLALVLKEPHTDAALQAWEQADCGYAWRWAQVEATAGLARRGARASDWQRLDDILGALLWIDLPPDHVEHVARANRKWHLRAADAGHLYCFQQASVVIPGLDLVCFDREMLAVARHLGLAIWAPPAPPASVREKRARYTTRRSRKRS